MRGHGEEGQMAKEQMAKGQMAKGQMAIGHLEKGRKAARIACALTVCAAVMASSGCGGKDAQESQSEVGNASALAGSENMAIAERSWEDKAEIVLGDTVEVKGSGAKQEENKIVISEGGSYKLSGTSTDCMVYVDTDDAVRLLLDGVDITSKIGPAIYVEDAKEVWVETAERTQNALSDASVYQGANVDATNADTTNADAAKGDSGNGDSSSDSCGIGAIFSNDDLVFTGSGELSVNGNCEDAIASDGGVYIQGGTYAISAVKDGIHANDEVVISSGDVTVTDANDGCESEDTVVMNGGNYAAHVQDDGMAAAGDLTINGGTVDITACEEGIESKANLYVNGGEITIAGNDDGLNASTLVQINGGTILINMQTGDGLDSNGTLEINGGLVLALGGSEPEGGADCDTDNFFINGGTLIATGGVNSAPSEADSAQPCVLLGAASQGDAIGIKDASGKTVFAWKATKGYTNMILSGDFLQDGESYEVYTGGSISGDETAWGYVEDADYDGGTKDVSFTVDGKVISAGGTVGMQGGMGGQFRGGMDGQMPDGARDGRFPDGMQDGQMPEAPQDGQFRGGMDGQMPDDGTGTQGQFPDGEQDSTGTQGETPEMPTAPSEDGDGTGTQGQFPDGEQGGQMQEETEESGETI